MARVGPQRHKINLLNPSGYCITTSLNTQKFYILLMEYLYLLYVSQERTSKFSLYNPQRLAFIAEEAFTARYVLELEIKWTTIRP